MRFQVPQFIDYEVKIIGPLTFRQFIFVGTAGAVCFVLKFALPTLQFVLATVVIMSFSLTLAFLKVWGRPLPTVLMNLFNFYISSRIYLWKKKDIMPKFITVEKISPKKKEEEKPKDTLPLKIAERSRLKQLSTQIETQRR